MTRLGTKLWTPTSERVKNTRLIHLQKKLIGSSEPNAYWDFHRWSVNNPDEFWQAVSEDAGVCWQTPPATTLLPPETGKMRGARWFDQGTLNFAENLIPQRECDDLIVSLTEGVKRKVLSTKELRSQVARLSRKLRSIGVTKGDRVAGVVGNGWEALVAMLATASIGGVWASCSPDFGTNAIVDRLGQVDAKVMFYTTSYLYGGRKFDTTGQLKALSEAMPSLQAVVYVSPLEERVEVEMIGRVRGYSWDIFLDENPSDEIEFTPMAFDDPLYIMFSSGTTGVPKCITHSLGGTLLQHKKELLYHCDLDEKSRLLYFTTCGWMMWNWMVSALSVGARLVLFDGSVAQPDLSTLWKTVETEKVTALGVSPKYLAACAQVGIEPAEAVLNSLRTILSTGAPLAPEQYTWVYDHVKQDLHLASISGGTDIISCFMLGIPTLPVYAGEIQGPGLGMDIHAWNEDGKDVRGEKGELVCTSPFPSMPVNFWNDPEGLKYTKAYFSHFDGGQDASEVWRHGDYVEFRESGGIVVYGRSDATLNPGGVRIGTAEIYRQVEALDCIEDSIAVGERYDGDTRILLFVKIAPGQDWNKDREGEIRSRIKAHLTPRHLPHQIFQVNAIPYTRSGKKVEMAVTQAIHGEEVKNLSALANPEAMDYFFDWEKDGRAN